MMSKYVNPYPPERVSSMTQQEAEIWYRSLMEWIDKNHSHLRERQIFRDLVDDRNYWRQAFWELMWHKHSSYKLLVDKLNAVRDHE